MIEVERMMALRDLATFLQRCHAIGLSWSQLAVQTGVERTMLFRIAHRERQPRIELALKIVDSLVR